MLSEADVGRLVAAGATPSEIAKLLVTHSSGSYGLGNTSYASDVYIRIGLACSGAIRQLKHVKADFEQDGGLGVRLDFREDGRPDKILVTPEEIASVPRSARISYFGRFVEICRQKLNER